MFSKIDKRSIPEMIIEDIKSNIFTGNLKLGEQLPSERVLAQMFSASRASVREALKALQYMGLVEVRQGDGCFVKNSSAILPEDSRYLSLMRIFSIREFTEAREVLEGQTVRLAAMRATDKELKKIMATFEGCLKKKGDLAAFLKMDYSFHLAIAEASQNGIFVQMIKTIRDTLYTYAHDVLTWPGQVDATIGCHKAIMQAVFDGDADLAVEKMIYHLENTKEIAHMILSSRLETNSDVGEDRDK